MSAGRICLYYRKPQEQDRWLFGDRIVRPLGRRLIRGKARLGGLDRVFANLCAGLDHLGISYRVNLPFEKLRESDRVGVLGRGRYSLRGYDRSNPIVAGIGLMTHPSEWPTLCQDYPVVRYLQHSGWTNEIYKPYYGDRCAIWPVGIDTALWRADGRSEDVDFLIYDKVYWDRKHYERTLIEPLLTYLSKCGLSVAIVRYGSYDSSEYRDLLGRARAMIFLSLHESQGLAYQECLSSNVPVLAWDQGFYLDPNRFSWGLGDVNATSVPYFDCRCGERFKGIEDFPAQLETFLQRLRAHDFQPRQYILDNLTLESCAGKFVQFLDAAATAGVT